MRVTVDRSAVSYLLDTILPLWRAKEYPYNRKDAIIPQTLIPSELRAAKQTLACFYFYVCIYMRGGIESKQAFNAFIAIWRAHPGLFDPQEAAEMEPEAIREILISFGLGWDSKNASLNWVENSKRLVRNWGGNPLSLLHNLRSYEEACRRILNKKGHEDAGETHGFLDDAGKREEGFIGFQYKMVSMLIYFYDWERWLPVRFLYPSPADFHNFRLGIAVGAITIKAPNGKVPRAVEYVSRPWRAAIMRYLSERKADPVEVADALWLYSLVMCGNSPVTITRKDSGEKSEEEDAPIVMLFTESEAPETWDRREWGYLRREALKHTCFVCPFALTCRPVPAYPYYSKGQLVIRKKLPFNATAASELLQKPAETR